MRPLTMRTSQVFLIAAASIAIGRIEAADAAKPSPKTAPAAASSPPPSPLPADVSLNKMIAADDLAVTQVLAEPKIAQPVYLSFDERGRLWVSEYRQYPFPAGITILSEDKYLRATYDKVPLPPPHHTRGADRITIHEDRDGDGTYDVHQTFIDGLNIASSALAGFGGVWVLNPPYLLFYPDRDRNDVPDGDPEVRLEGFGLEDTHSVVNSLQWGPDGWLYAAQGSTVSGVVKRPGTDDQPIRTMGQLIWRYHPTRRQYEVFAEGGGNAFGVEIDSKGELFSGHNGGDTRGFHYVQGAYLLKGFGKHGPLSNPFAFGYFPAMKHPPVPRFTHALVIEEGGGLPSRYHGTMLAVAPLQGQVMWSRRIPDQSTFRTEDLGVALRSDDPWFRPVDIKSGPDGAVYVADFYEGQIAHLRHHEGKIDPTNGRVYRLASRDWSPMRHPDLAKASAAELVDRLGHENRWQRRTALRLLTERKDAAAADLLRQRWPSATGELALEYLWALYGVGVLDDDLAISAIRHSEPAVRKWAVRLLGDDRRLSTAIEAALIDQAATEPNIVVRGQMASSARRWPASFALLFINALLTHSEDAGDGRQPLLLWWAIEPLCGTHPQQVVALLQDPAMWRSPLVREHLLHRIMRRFAQSDQRANLAYCVELLKRAPDAATGAILVRGFDEAFAGRSLTGLPDELIRKIGRFSGQTLAFRLRQGEPDALTEAIRILENPKTDSQQLMRVAGLLGEVPSSRAVPALLQLAVKSKDAPVRIAALASLQNVDDPSIAPAVLQSLDRWSMDEQIVALSLLGSRRGSRLALLEAVEAGKLASDQVPADVILQLRLISDPTVVDRVNRLWPEPDSTLAEVREQVSHWEAILREGTGSPYEGKKLFAASCGRCHRLLGHGNDVGPDLTPFKRDDVSLLLTHIIHPSGEIREGYETVVVEMSDGRTIVGVVADRDNKTLVVRSADGTRLTLAQEEIDQTARSKRSVMPEGLLKTYTPQNVRDLFAYLRSSQPLNE